jgi:hypothetical protein
MDMLRPFFTKNECRLCDCTAGGTFIWRDFFKTEFAIDSGYLYLKVVYLNGETAFTPPRGEVCGEPGVYEKILGYCEEAGCAPRLCAVSEQRLEKVLEFYPGAKVATDRAWSDYLYLSGDLISLAGRKYSGQRNHINRFMKTYANWRFETVGGSQQDELRVFFKKYTAMSDTEYPALSECNHKALEILDYMDHYRLLGGMLKGAGKVVGAALGEIVHDTLFVHVERADRDITGGYQMLVNQYANTFAQGVKYINREEDAGVEGLRTSKLSYHPVQLLDKYFVELG